MTREVRFKTNNMPATWQGWVTSIVFVFFLLGLFTLFEAGLSVPLAATAAIIGAVSYSGFFMLMRRGSLTDGYGVVEDANNKWNVAMESKTSESGNPEPRTVSPLPRGRAE